MIDFDFSKIWNVISPKNISEKAVGYSVGGVPLVTFGFIGISAILLGSVHLLDKDDDKQEDTSLGSVFSSFVKPGDKDSNDENNNTDNKNDDEDKEDGNEAKGDNDDKKGDENEAKGDDDEKGDENEAKEENDEKGDEENRDIRGGGKKKK